MEKTSHDLHRKTPGKEPPSPSPSSRALRTEQRRHQILDAANAVFQQHGFHGSSMAQMAAEAGMSVGHIYRYFENKEAVIAAISERDLKQSQQTMEAMLHDPAGVPAALLAGVDEGVAKMMDGPGAALFFEVMAEAAHNPKVADSVRLQHQALFACISDLFADGRTATGRYSAAEAVDLMTLVFTGLRIRAVQDPDADRTALARAIRTFIADLTGQG